MSCWMRDPIGPAMSSRMWLRLGDHVGTRWAEEKILKQGMGSEWCLRDKRAIHNLWICSVQVA